MRPIDFEAANKTLTLAGCEDLRCHSDDKSGIVTTVWEPTPDEREFLYRGGNIALKVMGGGTQPPVFVGVTNNGGDLCNQKVITIPRETALELIQQRIELLRKNRSRAEHSFRQDINHYRDTYVGERMRELGRVRHILLLLSPKARRRMLQVYSLEFSDRVKELMSGEWNTYLEKEAPVSKVPWHAVMILLHEMWGRSDDRQKYLTELYEQAEEGYDLFLCVDDLLKLLKD